MPVACHRPYRAAVKSPLRRRGGSTRYASRSMRNTKPKRSWGLLTHWFIALGVAVVLHILSWPLMFFVGFYSAMAAFGPEYSNPPKITYWQRPPPTPYESLSTAGYRFSASLVDTLFFGGPLPPEPVNPDPRDPQVNEKVKALGDKYFPEYDRRKTAYAFCWAFNEIFFGAMLASFYILFFALVRQVRRELPRA